jgi:hypothetical protein
VTRTSNICTGKNTENEGNDATVIAFLSSKPASYVTVAQHTMGSEWKRESAAAQDVDRTWDGKQRTMKDTRR